jgi:hypothetical protein
VVVAVVMAEMMAVQEAQAEALAVQVTVAEALVGQILAAVAAVLVINFLIKQAVLVDQVFWFSVIQTLFH